MTYVNRNPKKFGQLLRRAVRKIALLENKNIAVVQDELGFALGRESGGAAIQYWERGNVPAKKDDVERLKEELLRQKGLTQEEAPQFAGYAGFTSLEQKNLQPFIAGPPITQPRHFFGREYELKRLFGLWKYADMPLQNAVIIGPRGSGKTSLLFYLKSITSTPASQLRPGQRTDWLPQPEKFHWVFVDFRNPQLRTRAGLLCHLLTSLDLSVPTPCTLDRFVEVMRSNLLGPTVILLDEIGVALERYDELDDTFWDGLRALACTQMDGNLAFVLSARDLPNRLAQGNNRSSDFFSIFAYSATLRPFTEVEAYELIASSPIPFPPSDIEWILTQSQCWPLLIQILCRECLITLETLEKTQKIEKIEKIEKRETSNDWREEALHQLVPFQHLLST